MCLFVFKCLNDQAPQYIQDLIVRYAPSRSLRSCSQGLLTVKRIRLERAGARAFVYGCAKEWNELPTDIRNASNINSFKSYLKTYLFKKAFM